MTTEVNERDVLDAFIGSAAWDLIQSRLGAEWGRSGRRYGDLIEKVANSTDPVVAAREMQQVIWVRKEIEQFFAWFPERLAQLKASHERQELTQSRRGML